MKQVLLSVLGSIGLWNSQSPGPSCEMKHIPSPPLPPGHPASIQFSKWLEAFNTADKNTLLAYHSDDTFPYAVASPDIASIDRELMLAKGTGGFDIVEIESTSDEPSSVQVILHEKVIGSYARSTMAVDALKPNYPVTSFEINHIITPIKLIPKDDPRRPQYEKALAPLTPEKRQAVVDGIADVLKDQYVYPKLAEEIAAAVEVHLQNGDYDQFDMSEKFARQLSADIHSVGHDLHMGVAFVEPRNETGDKSGKAQKHLENLRPMNFGFGNVSVDYDTVPGRTIATLPINAFVPSSADFASDFQEIRKAIGDILTTVADADALLLDLRPCRGGDPETVAFVESYLLDGPLHTLDFVDVSGKISQSFSTLPADELPKDTRRFGPTKPLFVLTTKDTISGGEDMAYSLQAFKRAKSVIGEGNESTVGAANPITKPRWICEEIFGKGWWMVLVPNVRPVHTVTGTNWEGVGVKSDIVAGEGKWKDVSDAEEVGRKLAALDLESKLEL